MNGRYQHILALGAGLLAGMGCAGEVVMASDGACLVQKEHGTPTFLVSTTARWDSFGTPPMCIPWAKAKKRFGAYGWLYNRPNTIAKYRRMGFNALNAFALPTGYLALLPDYVPAATPEAEFAQLIELERRYGWYDPAKKLDALGYSRDERQWSDALAELRQLKDVPFYIDLHTSRPYRLSAARQVVGNKLDVPALFYEKSGSAFTQAFRLSSAEGREAFVKMCVHDARLYKGLGLKPWAYKLLNEPSYYDKSPETLALAPTNWAGTALKVEHIKVRERLMTDLCVRLRRALREVEPGVPTFAQVHAQAWQQNWNGIDLYALDKAMDIVSTGTGGYNYANAERAPSGTLFAEAANPGETLRDELGRMAFYRALGRGKPLVASEIYFGGMGHNRAGEIEKTLAHAAAEGVTMANLWEWSGLCYGIPHVSYVLTNPLGCKPQTWDAFPSIVKRLNALADFFPAGVRRARTKVACLFSNPTRRFAPARMKGFTQAVAALELAHIRADAIFEEELPKGPDCRLDDYAVIVAAGVEETLNSTDAALEAWLNCGGILVAIDAPMNRDEHGLVRENALVRRGHANIVTWAGEKPSFAQSLELRTLLDKHNVDPVAEVRDVTTGDLAPFVRVFRAENGAGLTGWMLANYSDTARLVSVKGKGVGPVAVAPFGTNAWPVIEGAMQILVPARMHAYAICGASAPLVARFGLRTRLDAADLRTMLDRMHRADVAKAPRRESVSLSIKAQANGGFDNQQGWACGSVWRDERGDGLWGVPYHGQTFCHVDFDIIRFDFNENRTTIALASQKRPAGLTRTAPLSLGTRPLRGIALLAAAVHAKAGETAGTLEVAYGDGHVERQPLRVGMEVGDWMTAANAAVMQKRCVWKNTAGRGFFYYEWVNPRPSETLASMTLTGGEGASALNVLAISALPTRFARRYDKRVDIVREPLTVGTDEPHGHSVHLPDGAVWPLTADEIPKGVLRFEMAQPLDRFGFVPAHATSSVSVSGRLADGYATQTDAHSVTEAGNYVNACCLGSVVTPDEWAEVEIPLWRFCTGENAKGEIKPITFVDAITLNYYISAPHRFRNVRVEW